MAPTGHTCMQKAFSHWLHTTGRWYRCSFLWRISSLARLGLNPPVKARLHASWQMLHPVHLSKWVWINGMMRSSLLIGNFLAKKYHILCTM